MAGQDSEAASGNLDFDPAALAGFLQERFGAGELAIERIGGGQSNPTYFVDHGGQRLSCASSRPGRSCAARMPSTGNIAFSKRWDRRMSRCPAPCSFTPIPSRSARPST